MTRTSDNEAITVSNLAQQVLTHAAALPKGASLSAKALLHLGSRAAVTGALDLAPSGDARHALAEDYRRMVEGGLLLDDAEPFDALLQRCQDLADKVNAATRRST